MKRCRPCLGFTLIELMIGLAIGVVIIAGVVSLYASAGATSRTSNQLATISETGAIGLYRLTDPIREAGYGEICCSDRTTNVNQTYFLGPDLRGCAAGTAFSQPAIGQSGPQDFSCVSTAGTADSLMVSFQANSIDPGITKVQANILDCTGQEPVQMAGNSGSTIPVVQDIYHFDASQSALMCQGPAGNAVVLIPNVSAFYVYYRFDDTGFANAVSLGDASPALEPEGTSVLTADQVIKKATGLVDPWKFVVAVEVCLDIRSSEQILNRAAPLANPYIPCPATAAATQQPVAAVASPDGYIHRSFREVITVRAHATGDPTAVISAQSST